MSVNMNRRNVYFADADPEGLRYWARVNRRLGSDYNTSIGYDRPAYTYPAPNSPDAPHALPSYGSIWDADRWDSNLNKGNSFNLNGRTGVVLPDGTVKYDDSNYVPFSQRPLETTAVVPRRELPPGISEGIAPVTVAQGNPNAEMMVVLPDGRRVPKSAFIAARSTARQSVPVNRVNANRDVNNVYSEAYANANRPAELTPWEYYQKYVLR